jgi:hypothetical protein
MVVKISGDPPTYYYANLDGTEHICKELPDKIYAENREIEAVLYDLCDRVNDLISYLEVEKHR